MKAVKVEDYENVDAVAAILTHYKIDAVVSTVAWAAVKAQYKIADAAKKAGVKLFAPSEFGSPDGAPFPAFQEKDRVAGGPFFLDSLCSELRLSMTALV